ncbi:hypothetical protein [Clavibacter sp. MX14-G9D]|uniref:hypothetical protein n=1 Tax=Clavibacter sp. MX14-G9D TaxID=3064656 RepID=UPI00293F6FF2|nr:hypothetical protein [Clavibacter sp. MX14-G9D]
MAVRPSTTRPRRGTADPVPLIAGYALLAVSLVLAVCAALLASVPVTFGPVALPIVQEGAWWIPLLGYVATPLLLVVAYGLDVVGQRRRLRDDRNFAPRPDYTTQLRLLIASGLVLGIWHTVNLSVTLSAWWGLS